jgi:adenine/guanine/hypoxanthine permease
VLIVALTSRRVVGGILIGVLVVSVAGIPLGLATYSGVLSMPPSLGPTLLQLDFSRVFELTFLVVIFSFLIIDVFDNAGTLIGVAHCTGLVDANGNLPRMRQALIADSFAAVFGSLIGTSTDILSAGAVLLAACRHGASLCLGGGAPLCRLRDDAGAC